MFGGDLLKSVCVVGELTLVINNYPGRRHANDPLHVTCLPLTIQKSNIWPLGFSMKDNNIRSSHQETTKDSSGLVQGSCACAREQLYS